MTRKTDAAAGPVRTVLPRLRWQPASALRRSVQEGYSAAKFRADLLAALVVGVVALPLSMALAIASGVPPQHGLYTAIVGGALIALLGGSRVQVSGPTAAFVIILAPISHAYGLSGLLLATMLAGLILVAMGVTGLGRLIEFIPHPVTGGFTAGIAVVIATLQLRDFFGLQVGQLPEHYLERIAALARAANTVHWPDLVVGVVAFTLLLTVPKLTRRVPAPIVALTVAGLLAFAGAALSPQFEVATIASRFGGIPRGLPVPAWPWDAAGAAPPLEVRALIGPAFAIAMLGAIESLLSAVVADGMTGFQHDPDTELVAQGIGNVVAPFFGGIAATGAIARTATNIRSGGRTPIAAILHAVFVLAAMLMLAPLLGYLPMSALAALLLIVAWNMSDVRHALRLIRIAPRSDVAVLLICFGLTVVFDMVVAVSAGVVLAALLFMRRMAELATVRLVHDNHPAVAIPLPAGVILYEVAGPLFFGAAQRAFAALRSIRSDVRAIILDMRSVTVMDGTGLVTLESTLDGLHKAGVFVVIAGVQSEPLRLMARAGWKHRPWLVVWRSLDDAVALVRSLAPSDLEALSGQDAQVAAAVLREHERLVQTT